ncbi:SLOG family protein (plasmid) [Streptosporangium sp. CA-135522]|uniref:SLOG family protein n=1 Tax=Streptosporangium sp. CA-135522 TaxID=3240072 RepID=UPI003D94BEC2
MLICGSRDWPWPGAVHTVCDRLESRSGKDLVLIEGAARGADRACHDWCEAHGLGTRHRCFRVDWAAERAARPDSWRKARPERNTRMLAENPKLIIACHEAFLFHRGGTSDMCLRALLVGVPVWFISGPNLSGGQWLRLEMFPRWRAMRAADLLRRMYPEMTPKILLTA